VEAKVILMDEPLSNLDALLRLEMRAELKSLLAKLGATTIYVTHDQIEALSMGDRIAVMQKGKILQYDHPTRVYDRPSHHFVGSFIGNPPMNFIPATIQRHDGKLVAKIGDFIITPDDAMTAPLSTYDGKQIWLGIRAENMEALRAPADDALAMTVSVLEPLGSMNLLTIHAHGETLKLATHPDFVVKPDETVWIRFPTNKVRWINRDTGHTIAPDLAQVMA
jgi:multiple sugar transport system ATP-binding protein